MYLVGESGAVYEVRLCEREGECKRLGRSVGGKEEDENGGKSKRGQNVIYHGVNLLGAKLEKIKLFRDLKCTTEL